MWYLYVFNFEKVWYNGYDLVIIFVYICLFCVGFKFEYFYVICIIWINKWKFLKDVIYEVDS